MIKKALKDELKESDGWRNEKVDDFPNLIIEMKKYEKAGKCLNNTEWFQVDDT